MLTGIAGSTDLGRPRIFGNAAICSGVSTSCAGRARAKSSFVHSGLSGSVRSTGGLRGMAAVLLSVGAAQTDRTDDVTAQGEGEAERHAIDQAVAAKAALLEAAVGHDHQA